MVKIIKKSDFSKLLPIVLMFAAFFLSRPIFSYFTGAETNWLEGLRGMAAVVTMVLAVYFGVICLRIRDHWRELANSKTPRDE